MKEREDREQLELRSTWRAALYLRGPCLCQQRSGDLGASVSGLATGRSSHEPCLTGSTPAHQIFRRTRRFGSETKNPLQLCTAELCIRQQGRYTVCHCLLLCGLFYHSRGIGARSAWFSELWPSLQLSHVCHLKTTQALTTIQSASNPPFLVLLLPANMTSRRKTKACTEPQNSRANGTLTPPSSARPSQAHAHGSQPGGSPPSVWRRLESRLERAQDCERDC